MGHEVQAHPPRLTDAEIAALTLDEGSHSNPKNGHCLLEVVSMFAGEPFGDSPACVDPVLATFGRSWNDNLPTEQRQQLKVYIALLPGTAQGPELSQVRGWMAADWLIRVATPAWLALNPATAEHAATLRALAPITSEQRLAVAQVALDQARSAAAAAWAAFRDASRDAAWAAAWAASRDAAWDAAWAASRDAAWAAAWAASRDAAWAAAWAAAWDAAWDAAWAAARDAAWAAAWDAAWAAAQKAKAEGKSEYDAARAAAHAYFAQTTNDLQASAHDLYLRMINAKLEDAAALDRAGEVQP